MKLDMDMTNADQTQLHGARYWKSLDDLAETPAFQEWVDREFPQGASELQGVNRRHFLKIMAASFGLAGLGLTGCRGPEHKILPYVKQPEHIIPGIPQFYSTSRPTPWENVPLVVETHQARPTKIEGNPSYHASGGATDVFTQASVLDLYDPARAKRSRSNGKSLNRSAILDLLTDWSEKLKESGGKGFGFLAEKSTSPSRKALVKELREKYPQLVWAEYEPIDYSAAEAAAKEYWGKPVRVAPKFSSAKRILAVDSDFLGQEPGNIENTRAFSRGRKADQPEDADRMNRLYSVEGNLTVTGAMADHRLRLENRHMEAFLVALAVELIRMGASGDSALTGAVRSLPLDTTLPMDWVSACAKDLYENKGEALVVAGPGLPQNVQWLTFFINDLLDAKGNTLELWELPDYEAATIQDLAKKLKAGDIETLFVLGGNPVFNAPSDLDWALLQTRASEVVRFGYWDDETMASAGTQILLSHYLETWGDGETRDGTYVPVQPMIMPLVESFSELEVLALLADHGKTDPYDIVKETFGKRSGSDQVENSFNTFLAVGVLPESGYNVTSGNSTDKSAIALSIQKGSPETGVSSPSNLEVQFRPSNNVGDGRFANNGWMMECPDPISKLTWDNAILISPRLAKDLQEETGIHILPGATFLNKVGQIQRNTSRFHRGREQALIAYLTIDGVELRAPIHVLPGLADYAVVLPVGFGRDVVGPVGTGAGYNFYPAMKSDNRWFAGGAKIKITEEVVNLANVQEHWSMEGRALLRESSVQAFAEDPEFVSKMGMESHSPPIYGADKNLPLQEKVTQAPRGGSAYNHPEFTAPQQWGMVIDLNLCTGCNACVVACQSENNIPIVGKDQVLRGREMHWIRLDRYFSTNSNDADDIPGDVQVSYQGMACQHCELAPCETVCPVNATVHDEQGLNVMAYNRCVGTRYCANNCPYKVRRFNFFDWNKRKIGEFYKGPLGEKQNQDTIQMQRNPDVTVRMRGVMEKCTYCVQRIEQAKMQQKAKAGASPNILVPDGRIKTACQQVCPAEAIVFGDVKDANTEVSQWKNSPRDYSVLGYLNIRPRTTYLAKLRNPNPGMPEKYRYEQPFGRMDYENRFGHGASLPSSSSSTVDVASNGSVANHSSSHS